MDRRVLLNMHKLRPTRFGQLDQKRQDELKKIRLQRQSKRTSNFNAHRNINIVTDAIKIKQNKTADRKLALQKYKAEKEVIKKTLKEKTRPPFKVGIPHHGSSPILKDVSNLSVNVDNKKKPIKVPVKPQHNEQIRVTRATTRTGVAKQTSKLVNPLTEEPFVSHVTFFPFTGRKTDFNFQAPKKVISIKKLTSPHTPTVLKRSAQKNPNMSRQKIMHNIIPKKVILSTKLSDSVESLATPLPSAEDGLENVDSLSRGVMSQSPVPSVSGLNQSQSSKTSNDWEELFLSPNVTRRRSHSKHTPMKQAPSVQSETSSDSESKFQRSRVDNETSHLLELANTWHEIALKEKLSQDIVDEIDSLVGQTRLLTQDKFSQFRGLIDQFDQKTGTHLITIDDLNGFWDMVYLQVEPLEKRYKNLEALKSNNWVPAEPPMKKKRYATKKVQPTAKVSSSIRSTIQAHRAAKMALSSPAVQEESGITIPTGNKNSLLANVFSNKRLPRSNSPSPYIAMRLSGIGRSFGTPSQELDENMEPNTKPKSILRKQIKCESPETSQKTVLSNQVSSEDDSTILGEDESTHLTLKQEPEEQINTDTQLSQLFIDSTEVTPTQKVRKSARLMHRPTTPNERRCPMCNSPDCTTCGDQRSNTVKKTRLSRRQKNASPSPNKLESTSKNQLIENNLKEDSQEAAGPSKRFMLKPSTLVVSDITNVSTVPKRSKRSKQVITRGQASSPSEPSTAGPSTERHVLRSSKRSSARKVTFNSTTEEKPCLKLPVTPYRTSLRGKKSVELDSDD